MKKTLQHPTSLTMWGGEAHTKAYREMIGAGHTSATVECAAQTSAKFCLPISDCDTNTHLYRGLSPTDFADLEINQYVVVSGIDDKAVLGTWHSICLLTCAGFWGKCSD